MQPGKQIDAAKYFLTLDGILVSNKTPPYGNCARHKCFALKSFSLNRINTVRSVSPPVDFVIRKRVFCGKTLARLLKIAFRDAFGFCCLRLHRLRYALYSYKTLGLPAERERKANLFPARNNIPKY